jgi:hypothetical protein
MSLAEDSLGQQAEARELHPPGHRAEVGCLGQRSVFQPLLHHHQTPCVTSDRAPSCASVLLKKDQTAPDMAVLRRLRQKGGI